MGKKQKQSKLNRRQFIKNTVQHGAMVFGGASFLRPALSYSRILGDQDVDCLVLGAGMSGITAARDLEKRGHRVKVLEGSSRIGGRIQTEYRSDLGGAPIELGAEYIHRKKDKVPLWEEMKRYKLGSTLVDRTQSAKIYHDQFGKPVSTISAATKWNLLEAMFFFEKMKGNLPAGLTGRQWLDQQNYNQLGRDLVSTVLNGHLPATLDDLSMRGFASDRVAEQLQEGKEYQVHGGLLELLGRMANGLSIEFHQRVKAIRYSSSGVEVVTSNTQTGRDQHYRAKTAVISFSVEMLKSGEIDFQPGLPSSKLEALKRIRQGPESKLVLFFDRRFWPKGMSMLSRLDQKRRLARTIFVPFYGDNQDKPILTAFLGSQDARALRKILSAEGELAAVKAACADLDEVFPEEGGSFQRMARDPERFRLKYIVKEWERDPWSKGGVSYLTEAEPTSVPVEEARTILGDAKTTPGLFWAGEATSTCTQPASLHGAHWAGMRAGIQASRYLRSKHIIPMGYFKNFYYPERYGPKPLWND